MKTTQITAGTLPVGTILPYAGATAPAGFLLCDGSEISRTTYAALFATIGTTFGAGNGSTTFNLPNLSEKFIIGAGGISFPRGSSGGTVDHLHMVSTELLPGYDITIGTGTYDPNAYGVTDIQPHLPPYVVVNFIIKY